MFIENENEIENNNGVESAGSPEPQLDAQPDLNVGQESSKEPASAPKEVPFHEHPRWKEVMAERDAEKQAKAELQRQLQEMRSQIQQFNQPKSNKPDFNEVRTKMGERLKTIDPEFGSYMALLEEQALSAKQEMSNLREERLVETLVGKFQELSSKSEVPAEMAGLYQAQLDQMYREGKIRSSADMEAAFKSVHEPLARVLEAREKAYLEKYTAGKKQEAGKPAPQPKGRSAPQGNPNQKTFADPAARKQALIADIVKQSKASSDI